MPREEIIFDKWTPDFDPKSPGLVEANEVVPYDAKYIPLQEPVAISDAAAGVPLDCFTESDNVGSKSNFLATTTKVYRITSGSSLSNITNTGADYTTSGDVWDWDVRGDSLYMCNFDDNTQVLSDLISTANLADLGGSPPKAKTCAWYRNQLFFGYTDESGTVYPRRLRRSAKGAATDYTTTTSGAGFQDIDAWGQAIRSIRTISSYLAVYMDKSVWIVDELGPQIWFSYTQIFEGDGPVSVHAVAELDDGNHIFMGEHDIYLVSGVNVRPLNAPIRRSVLDNVDPDSAYLTTSLVDRDKKIVYWAYASQGNSIPNKLLIYNYGEDRFTDSDLSVYCAGNLNSLGYTINGLDALSSTIDGLPSSAIDSAFYNGGFALNGVVNLDKKLSGLSGAGRNGTIRTGGLPLGNTGTITSLRPLVEQPDGTITGTVRSRFNDSQAFADADSRAMDSNGVVWLRGTGRYVQIKIETTGEHTGARGVLFDVVERGSRA